MNFIKDWANIFKTCTRGDRLKVERVLFWLIHNFLSNSLIHKYVFGSSIIVQKDRMIQVTSCE